MAGPKANGTESPGRSNKGQAKGKKGNPGALFSSPQSAFPGILNVFATAF